jgi:glycosyltransferase 2 family protein
VKNKLRSYASIIIPILLGAGLTYYTYNSFSPEQIAQMNGYFKSANYNYVLVSLLLAFSGYVLRSYRWKYTLAHIGTEPNFKLNFLAVSIGYFVNLSIPRSGEVSRALILKKYQNVPFDKAFGTIIAERIVDFMILLFLISIALIVEFSTIKNFLLLNIPLTKLVLLLGIGFAGLFTFLYLYKYSNWKVTLLLKTKIEGLKEGVLSVVKMPNKWSFLFYTALIWTSYIMMFYCTIFALKATSSITLGTILVAFVIGSLTIAFTNGGFGFFPILIAKILFLYGIPLEAGNAFGWIIWTSQLIITIVLGIFSFIVLPLVVQKK